MNHIYVYELREDIMQYKDRGKSYIPSFLPTYMEYRRDVRIYEQDLNRSQHA